MLPKGTHEYAKFIRPSELLAFCNDAGLVEADLKGLHFNPLTQRYWLDQKTQVNYFLALQKRPS
jgi:2-polyprenyl-6-hydroxyphenyl methylase/3-demethylubiquinone-9 3-methyltransferase